MIEMEFLYIYGKNENRIANIKSMESNEKKELSL